MPAVTLQFLGCGDAFGSGGRLHTCFHVIAGETRFLVDCGASALIAMKRWGIDRNAVETIVISHLHGDHFGGLPFFLLDARYVSQRRGPLTVAGPPGLERRVRSVMDGLFAGSAAAEPTFALRFVELPADRPTELGAVVVTPREVVHPSGAPSYGLRIECADRVLAYSGDTEWTEALPLLARDADLFICECYAFDRTVPYHLDYRTVVAERERLGAHRLVLTHLGEEVLAHLDELELEAAEDGGVIRID